RRNAGRARDDLFRLSGAQPYPEFRSRTSAGRRLMKAILSQFAEEVRPTPVLIVPIPSYEFYLNGLKPIYQEFFEELQDPARGVFVADASRPLVALPYETRRQLTFRSDGHFTPFANKLVAGYIADGIRR